MSFTPKPLDEAIAAIGDGCMLAIPHGAAGAAMEATRALIRRGVKDLHLVAVPTATLQADLLIGAGCVGTIETSAVSLGEFGPAPRFAAAVKTAGVRMRDATCPAIYTALQAAEKGAPFMPLRGLIGSDLLRHRDDWRVIDNPFAAQDPVVLLPALAPDVALFHAKMADRAGNVWIGRERELALMAHAAKTTIVTVETMYDGVFYDDPVLAVGALSGIYLGAVALAPRGAWPLSLPDQYELDGEHLALYARLAATAEGFARYLEDHVHERRAA